MHPDMVKLLDLQEKDLALVEVDTRLAGILGEVEQLILAAHWPIWRKTAPPAKVAWESGPPDTPSQRNPERKQGPRLWAYCVSISVFFSVGWSSLPASEHVGAGAHSVADLP